MKKNKFFILFPSKKFNVEQLNSQVDIILEEFDFDKIHKVMKHIRWTWSLSKEAPSPFEIKKMSKKLLKETIKRVIETGGNLECCIETGGLRAEYHPSFGMSLSFILEQFGNFEDY